MFDPATLIGLIWMIVLGPAVGNYMCSVVYRLPRGRTPFEQHPYCGQCNADLQPSDLFPILSWLSTRGKCRYCEGAIPGIYTIIELACLAVFVSYFLVFGMGELFLLYTAYAVFVITLAAIEWQQGWLSSSIYGYALVCAGLARTVAEGTIYGWVKSFVVVLVACLLFTRLIKGKQLKLFEETWIWWLALIAAALPMQTV